MDRAVRYFNVYDHCFCLHRDVIQASAALDPAQLLALRFYQQRRSRRRQRVRPQDLDCFYLLYSEGEVAVLLDVMNSTNNKEITLALRHRRRPPEDPRTQ